MLGDYQPEIGRTGSPDGRLLTASTLGLGNVLGTCASASVSNPSLPAEATTTTPRWFKLLTEACEHTSNGSNKAATHEQTQRLFMNSKWGWR